MAHKTTKKELKEISREVKKLIVYMAYNSKSGEVGPALSISDILAVLYFRIMDIDPKKPKSPLRDRFILSKGHAAPALYSTLALRGYFTRSLLDQYRTNDGVFHLHPCSDAACGIEASTGSLGHGLSMAAGMALSFKRDKKKNNVFVLVGDGECNEGSVWEAAMFASSHKLNNLIVIVDDNKFQGFGASKDVHDVNLTNMWQSFGWDVVKCDGHDLKDIERALVLAKKSKYPAVVVADTVNGKGIPEIENTLLAHYFSPDEEVYNNRHNI